MERSLHAQDADLFLRLKHAGKQMAVWGIVSFFDVQFAQRRHPVGQNRTRNTRRKTTGTNV